LLSSRASPNPHPPSTGRRDRWLEELTPFATCGRLRGAERLSGFCAATGEMDECPRHRERRESVALRGSEQLVKRCVGSAPAKANQYAEGGIKMRRPSMSRQSWAGTQSVVMRYLPPVAPIPMPITDPARTIAMICVRPQWWPDPRTLRDAYVISLVPSDVVAGGRCGLTSSKFPG
jgi:hypothetical protein